jgi:hypothetical protein
MAKAPAPAPAPVVRILDARILRAAPPEGSPEGTLGPITAYNVEHASDFPDGTRRGTETILQPEGQETPLDADALAAEIVRRYT